MSKASYFIQKGNNMPILPKFNFDGNDEVMDNNDVIKQESSSQIVKNDEGFFKKPKII